MLLVKTTPFTSKTFPRLVQFAYNQNRRVSEIGEVVQFAKQNAPPIF